MLLDQHGQPLRLSDIAEPQTSKIATLQNTFHEGHLEGLTPAKARRILREADQGNLVAQHELFEDMLDRDAHLSCEFGKRTGALLGLDWSIEPPANASAQEKKDAAWAEEILRDVVDDLEDLITAMMGAVGHGFGPIEQEWKRWGNEWLPTFHPRPQSWFQMDLNRRQLRLIDGSSNGAELIAAGWIMHTHGKAKTGYLARMGICRVLIWPFIYKHYAVGDFAEFLETYGLPIILGKYYQGATAAEKSSLMRAVTALGHDARAIMPKEMELEIQKIAGSGDGSVHLAMVDWAERSQSKAILGQTLSAEAKATGMGSGVADLHGEVRHDILKSDARQIAGTLTRDLVYPLLVLNGRGGDALRRCPRWRFDLGDAEDLKTYADTLPKLAQGGARIAVSWVHEKLRIPMAEEGEEIFGASNAPEPPPGPPPGPAPAAPAKPGQVALKASGASPDVAPDAIDAIVDNAMGDWEEVLAPMVDPLQAAMDDAAAAGETAEQLLARLPALLPQMAVAALAEHLAKQTYTTRLAGEAGLPTVDGNG